MIYLIGDTHGSVDLNKIEELKNKNILNKSDHIIILGDIGVIWSSFISTNKGIIESKRDLELINFYQEIPCKVLFIDGNHENFEVLENYPSKVWNGGEVGEIRSNIFHLKRGNIYKIEGKTFFTFGGGVSIDRGNRTKWIDYWEREMPSSSEYEKGLKSLDEHFWEVDFILTHTLPMSIVKKLIKNPDKGEFTLNKYLEHLMLNVDYSYWFAGHFHIDGDFPDNDLSVLFENIIELD